MSTPSTPATPAAPPRDKRTKKQLLEEVARLALCVETQQRNAAAAKDEARSARDEAKETREHFADLKTRLHNAELEIATMRGYVDRVQEDDVVHEPLVLIGDPAGEQRLVAKRKHRMFPLHHVEAGMAPAASMRDRALYDAQFDRRTSPPKHWITY